MAIKICLDAGHYGKYNQSPVVPEYYESDMNWKLHLKMKKELESYGFSVVTTRSSQTVDRPLLDRGKASKGCDLFLSLHSNAASTEPVDYVTVLHLAKDDSTSADEKSKEIAQKLAPIITDVMGVAQKAYRVDGVVSKNDRNGDGILNDNHYGVLHGARTVNVPGLILEHSFHTNTKATKWLLDDGNLDKLAKAEAKAIAEYFGMTKKEETTETKKEEKTVTVELKQIKKGSICAEAGTLQVLLKELGYKGKDGKALSIDGNFGTNTDYAVRAFQKAKGLAVDGIVGKNTWTALFKHERGKA